MKPAVFWLPFVSIAAIAIWQASAPAAPTLDDGETIWSADLAKQLDPQARNEVVLFDGTRVDILTPTYAIEVDWVRDGNGHRKWYEAVGQSVHYAILTDRKPAMLLLSRDPLADRTDIMAAVAVAQRIGIVCLVYDAQHNSWIRPNMLVKPVGVLP